MSLGLTFGLGLLAALPVPPPPLPPLPAPTPLVGDLYGRWQPTVVACLHTLAGAVPGACSAVRVDQRGAGVVRISWPGSDGLSGGSRQLMFVGTLAEGSEPMPCSQAVCRLSRPTVLSLSTVSESVFDARGLARALPSAWSVSGRCRLDAGRIHCEARSVTGESWEALARLR
ncbi:MAG: hypothetical protein RLZZ124_568 [Cyanobacteriota bacterium]